MAFPEGFIYELKSRNDITEVISSYVSLKRRGRNMVGLCPFHGEKTPSFNIYTETDSFYCFGCGAAGAVITFIMKIENLDYVEAVKYLAQRAGLDMPEDSYDDSLNKLRRRVFEANREAARYFYRRLMSEEGKNALGYLRGRMLTDATIRHFGLGYAPDSWTGLCDYLKSKGFKENELVSANLAVRRHSGKGIIDRFRDRVMFPIIDLRGNVIAFGGRIMTDAKPKYLNSSDTPVFKKSENLFSLNNAKNTGSRALLLCEGYMDVISVNQAGFRNAVASLGTALTTEQAVLMKRYADEIIICYDADEAGQKATARAIPILRAAGLNIRVLTIPNGKDPDEFIRSKGADGPAAFRAIIEASGNDVDYRLQKLRSEFNLAVSDGVVDYLEAAAHLMAEIESPIERDVYVSKLSKEFGVDKNALLLQIETISKRRRRDSRRREARQLQSELSGRDDKLDKEHRSRLKSTAAEESLVVYLINNPDSLSYINSQISAEQFQNALMKRFFVYFSNRISEGLEPLNNITADFSTDEQSVLYRILHQNGSVAPTPRSLREYIEVIERESRRPSDKKSMSSEQISSYFDRIRRDKE